MLKSSARLRADQAVRTALAPGVEALVAHEGLLPSLLRFRWLPTWFKQAVIGFYRVWLKALNPKLLNR